MEIDIQIDSLTNCLVWRETGEQLDTEFRLVLKTISKKDAAALQRKGWKFDWSIPHQHDYEVYELLLKDDTQVQGMIALKHIRDQFYTHVDYCRSCSGEYRAFRKIQGRRSSSLCNSLQVKLGCRQ